MSLQPIKSDWTSLACTIASGPENGIPSGRPAGQARFKNAAASLSCASGSLSDLRRSAFANVFRHAL